VNRMIRALTALGAALVFVGCAAHDDERDDNDSNSYEEVTYSDEFKAAFQDWVDRNIPARTDPDAYVDVPLTTDQGLSWLDSDESEERAPSSVLTEKSVPVNLNGWRVSSTLALVNPPNGWHYIPTKGTYTGFQDFATQQHGHCGSNVLSGPDACLVPE